MTHWLIAPLLGSLLALSPAVTAQASRGQSADVGQGGRPTATAELDEAGRQLAAGTAEVGVLAVHAKTLLDADRIEALRGVLVGPMHSSIEGVLQALRARGEDLLVPETLQLAAGLLPGDVRPIALENLVTLCRAHPRVIEAFIDWMDEDARPDAERLVLVEVLGHSRDLRAVSPLVTQLYGPHGEAAHRALQHLTGQPGPKPGTTRAEVGRFWSDFWEGHDDLPRDQLMEVALNELRAQVAAKEIEHARTIAHLRIEVIDARTERMGTDVGRLTKALDDDYREVRLEAARRLADHDNKQQAASAVPVLLARIDRHAAGTNGSGEHEPEADPDVRAAMVAALGSLGRNQDAVRGVLAAELRSEHPDVARAAVQGLSLVRRRPDVVRPLLDYLQRIADAARADRSAHPDALQDPSVGPEVAVSVLQAVAENQPGGVIPRLQHWLQAEHGPRVRAAAVRALLASTDVDAALDALADIALGQENQLFRYNVALGLGIQALALPGDAPARGRILARLSELVDDPDPSVRAEAATSLGMTAERGALSLLERRSQIESDPSVLVKIMRALGDLGFPDGVRVVGRLHGQRHSGRGDVVDAGADLLEPSQEAVAAIGRDGDASDWLAMGDQLREVGALALSAWTYKEVERRFSAAPEYRLVVNEAKGNRARVLWDADQCEEAVRLLNELHRADAPHPPPRDRLEMLGSCSEVMGNHAAAADAFLELLGLIQEGAAGRAGIQRDAVRTLRGAGRYAEALPLLATLIESDPSNNELLEERGRLLEGLGQWEQAVATYERLYERIPEADAEARQRVAGRIADLRLKMTTNGGTPAVDASRSEATSSGSDRAKGAPADVTVGSPDDDGDGHR